MSKRSPRLQFSDEEKAAPELKKAIQKAEKQSDKLDKAEAKIPKKTVQKKQFVVDADGKVTKHLHFDEVDKKTPPSKLSHAVKAAPVDTVLATARREIRESEDENVGVEGAHSLEQTAEECSFKGAKFIRTDTEWVAFGHSNMTGARFIDCDMRNTILQNCCVDGTDFGNAYRGNMHMEGVSDNEQEWLADAGEIKMKM